MSIIDDAKEANQKQAALRANTAQEHMAELERQRIASENYKTPAIVAFKKRRAEQAMKHKRFFVAK